MTAERFDQLPWAGPAGTGCIWPVHLLPHLRLARAGRSHDWCPAVYPTTRAPWPTELRARPRSVRPAELVAHADPDGGGDQHRRGGADGEQKAARGNGPEPLSKPPECGPALPLAAIAHPAVPRKACGRPLVELGGEVRFGRRSLGARVACELGEVIEVGRHLEAEQAGVDRRELALDVGVQWHLVVRPIINHLPVASHRNMALLSFWMTRCSLVPAFVSEVPVTLAISAFVSPAKNFNATSSRSRGAAPPSQLRNAARRIATSASSCAGTRLSSSGSATSRARRRRRRSSSSAALRAIPNSHARRLPRPGLNVRRRR